MANLTQIRKRKRATYTIEQIDALTTFYQGSQYIKKIQTEELGYKLGLTPNQVKVWFQNRRSKEKKEKEKECEQYIDSTTNCQNMQMNQL